MSQPALPLEIADPENPPELGSAPTIASVAELLRELLAWTDELRDEIADIKSALGTAPAQPVQHSPAHSQPTQHSPAAKHAAYRELVARVKTMVSGTLPRGSTVAVISKGDDDLLAIDGLRAWHFPRYDTGVYTGHHPADSDAAIAHLENVRDKGAEFLVIPQTSMWWLDHYAKFREYLDARCRSIARQADTCAIFQLRERAAGAAASTDNGGYDRFRRQLRSFITHVLPKKARLAVVSKGDPELLNFPGLAVEHFPSQKGGAYAGHHPADSAAAIAQLEDARADGCEYFLIPATSLWWLDFYEEFRDHLAAKAKLVARQKHLGVLYFLSPELHG